MTLDKMAMLNNQLYLVRIFVNLLLFGNAFQLESTHIFSRCKYQKYHIIWTVEQVVFKNKWQDKYKCLAPEWLAAMILSSVKLRRQRQ